MRRSVWLVASVAAAVMAAACSSTTKASRSRAPTTTAPPSTTSTTVAPTTTAAPPPPGLGPGASGPQVLELEQRLDALHYEVGPVDGTYDADTGHGVMAFQKVNAMARSGRATDDVIAAVAAATSPPAALVPGGGANRVEIDLNRQVLFLYEGDALSRVLPVSTGSNARFCSEGWCRRAVTPQGAFRIYSKRRGWERSPLGRLYNSQYFTDGIAIHGSPSVPGHAASHGCVRIPMRAAEWFPAKVAVGTPVYVAGPNGVPSPLPPYVPPTSPAPTPPAAGTPAPAPQPGPVPTLAPPITYTPTPTTTVPVRPVGP